MNGRRTSRREVAQAAGVSDAMVSYALSANSKVKIKPETRERIIRVAREKGYAPNFIGKALVSRKSYNIGLLMPEKCACAISVHYLNLLHSISQAVNETDYCLSVFFGANDKYFRKINESRVDGVMILDSGFDVGHVEKTIAIGLPTVVVNLDYDVGDVATAACVRPDHETFIANAVASFASQGRKKILHISNYRASSPNMIRFDAFNRACADGFSQGVMGTTLEPKNHFSQLVDDILTPERNWDAFLVNDVNCANILCNAALERGLRPGEDFALVTSSTSAGPTNPSWGAFYVQPSKMMGRVAWETMEGMLDGRGEGGKILIPYEKVDSERNVDDDENEEE